MYGLDYRRRKPVRFCRHLDELDWRSESEGWADNDRPLCVPDDGAEWHCGANHPKAMPVILTTPEEIDTWLTAPAADALQLQRPLPDELLEDCRSAARGCTGAQQRSIRERIEGAVYALRFPPSMTVGPGSAPQRSTMSL